MLPDNFRLQFKNETGVTIDANKITATYRGKYFNSSGKLVFESESSNFANQTGTVANAAFHNSNVVDNGAKTDPLVEADLFIVVDLAANTTTPNGDVSVYLQRATADSPAWGTDGIGEVVAVLNFPNSKVLRQTGVTVR